MNVRKEAARDAAEFARSQMSFGDGAGTRRRHIGETVNYKAAHTPGYRAAFERELRNQDMVTHAKKARSERRRRDASQELDRNVRALARGDIGAMNTKLLIIVGAAIVAYKTGADRKAVEFVKFRYRKLKRKFTKKSAKDTVYNITNIGR